MCHSQHVHELAKIVTVQVVGVVVQQQWVAEVHAPPKEATISKQTMVTIILAILKTVCVDGAALNKGMVMSVATTVTVILIGVMVQLQVFVLVNVVTS